MNGMVKTEQWRHRNVFETYLLMGPSRTLVALSKATGVHIHTLQNWNKSFNWPGRMQSRDKQVMTTIEVENNKLLQTVIKKRHQEAYQKVTEKALAFIEKKGTSFAGSKTAMRDAAIALDIGVKGERDVLGLRDTKMKGAFVKDGFAAMIEMVMGS